MRRPDAVVDLYSRVAGAYEVWGATVDSAIRQRVLALAAVRDGDQLLEVGCGTGAQLAQLARLNPNGRTVGADLAPGMLRRAQRRMQHERLPGVEICHGSATALPFDDATFDTLCSAYVLDILPAAEIVRALAEFRRVLRPGGRLVLVNVARAERWWHRLPEALYGTGLPLTGNCRPIESRALLAQAGFLDRRREYSAQLLMPSEILLCRAPSDLHTPPSLAHGAAGDWAASPRTSA